MLVELLAEPLRQSVQRAAKASALDGMQSRASGLRLEQLEKISGEVVSHHAARGSRARVTLGPCARGCG